MAIERVLLIVLDGVGIGALPDANRYGDEGAHTLGHIANTIENFHIPHLEKLGLGAICPLKGVRIPQKMEGAYGKMNEISAGKDTTTGHWEMMGIEVKKPFPLFPEGFPQAFLDEFKQKTGIKNILGNYPASGTEIIQTLGEEHLRTGFPIIYTSGDSVFQIACHDDIFSLEALYQLCAVARKIGDCYQLGRVIARPFKGTHRENFERTPYRRDYSFPLPQKTVLDFLNEASIEVIGIGKIEDIFNGQGLTRSHRTKSNAMGVDASLREMESLKRGLIFANLVDFDQLYGHRRDTKGFASALMEFDRALPKIMKTMRDDGCLIITADHGTDPTYRGTDHTREFVPLLVYSAQIKPVALGTRKSFADIGQTIVDCFQLSSLAIGESFLPNLI